MHLLSIIANITHLYLMFMDKRVFTVEIINRTTGEYEMIVSKSMIRSEFNKWYVDFINLLFPELPNDIVIQFESQVVPNYYEGNLLF